MRYANIFYLSIIFVCVSSASSQTFIQFGSHEYYIAKNETKNYDGAVQRCNDSQAKLAIVDTKDIRDFLVQKINVTAITDLPESLYIGLKRKTNTGNNTDFEWADGSPLNYSDWYAGEPSNHGDTEDCVVMELGEKHDRNFQWNDVSCDTWETYYICQRSIGSSVTSHQTSLWRESSTSKYVTNSTKPNSESGVTRHRTSHWHKPSTSKYVAKSIGTKPTAGTPQIPLFVGVGVGGLLLLLFIIVIICLCRRKKRQSDIKIDANNVEESAHVPMNLIPPTDVQDMYAAVNKNAKKQEKADKTTEENGKETENDVQDMYAAVNKNAKKKEKADKTTEENGKETENETNLMYETTSAARQEEDNPYSSLTATTNQEATPSDEIYNHLQNK